MKTTTGAATDRGMGNCFNCEPDAACRSAVAQWVVGGEGAQAERCGVTMPPQPSDRWDSLAKYLELRSHIAGILLSELGQSFLPPSAS
jgi:hypothetical protein